MRVLFGHQSVGADLLAGLASGSPSGPSIVPTREPEGTGSFIAHFRVGSNGDPDSKIRDFVTSVAAVAPDRVDIALFKFCYVDITTDAIAAAMFDRYAAAMDQLQSRCPALTLAHITVPLRTERYGARGLIRRLLGQQHPERQRNASREKFNALLRDRYAATGALFDLADLEANGRTPRSLHATYTHDGGHLNARGQQALASAFLRFLQQLDSRRDSHSARRRA